MKNNLKYFVLGTLLLLAFKPAWAQQTGSMANCGNTQSPTKPSDNCEGANHFNVFNGDVQRDVSDLEVWGGVGEHKLAWTRLGHSRQTFGQRWFGDGHSWRHSYQWEMVAGGSAKMPGLTNSTGSFSFYSPDGGAYGFQKNPSGNWVSAAGIADTLTQNGTNYVLMRVDGSRYSFNKYTVPAVRYQLDKFYDAQSNVYTLSYDTNNRLSRVTEPAGRWLQINYQDIPVDSQNFTNLAVIPHSPLPPDAWSTLTATNTGSYRYVRYLAFGWNAYIAEIEFYDTNNVKLTGTAFGNSPALSGHTFDLATDGNTGTYYAYAYQGFGFTGLDLGTNKRIGSIRYYPVVGKEANLPDGLFQGANEVSALKTVIASVQTSDGRSVTYNYGTTNDAILKLDWLTLNSVSYGDGTVATYGYTNLWAGQPPLMVASDDPRVIGDATRMHYEYWQNSKIYGSIYAERGSDGTIIARLNGGGGIDSTNVTVTYANGAVRSFADNGLGNVVRSVDGLGRTTVNSYDTNGFLASRTDPLGHVTSYTRDSVGRPLTITAPDGGVRSYSYDSIGLLLSQTDELGHTTTYTRDGQHRVTAITYPDTSAEGWTYNGFSQPLTHTLRNGGVERFGYTTNGLMVASTNALGNVTLYSYYTNSLPATVTDANGHTTTYTYNERGQPLQVVAPDYSVKSYGYDGYGNPVAVTNELGAAWLTGYDEYRRVTTKMDPLSRTTVFDYSLPGSGGCSCANSQNKPTSIIQPGGEVIKMTYDVEWQLLNQTAGYGTTEAATTQYQYDTAGRLIAVIDPNGKTRTFGYDVNGRRTSGTDPLGQVTQWGYDLAGNKLTETRADGGVTTSSYNAMNRVTSTTDPLSRTTQMAYDASGNLITLTDGNGNVTHWSFDLLNRQVTKTYADSTQDKFGFDAVGNLASVTNAAGQIATHTYDSRNRLTQTAWNDGVTPTVTRSYDLAGRLATLDNGNAAEGYAYDAANQLLAETNLVGANVFVTGYGYDLDGRRQTLVYPSGNTLTNSFTARSQVKGIYENGAQFAGFTYDANGNRLSLSLNNGVTNGYSYDNASRLTALVAKQGAATVASFGYTYNSINNRTALAREDGRTENYGYDAAQQVTGASYGDGTSEGFHYDPLGNLTTRTNLAGGVDAFSPNNLNQYASVNGNALSYDAKGNLLAWTGGVFGYDAQNRLVGASRGTNGAIFLYDGRNRCVQRVINGVTTTCIYNGWKLIAEYQGTTPVAEYIHGPGTDEVLARATALGTVYYSGDALNSTAALTDGSGNVVEKYRYTAFGQPTVYDATGTNALTESAYGNRFAFQGREWFAEINLSDHRNRYYSPELNRWLNRDPIKEHGGINLYRNVYNNAVNKIDPNGESINGFFNFVSAAMLIKQLFLSTPGESVKIPDPPSTSKDKQKQEENQKKCKKNNNKNGDGDGGNDDDEEPPYFYGDEYPDPDKYENPSSDPEPAPAPVTPLPGPTPIIPTPFQPPIYQPNYNGYQGYNEGQMIGTIGLGGLIMYGSMVVGGGALILLPK